MPYSLVRVLQNTHPYGVLSKFNLTIFKLCKLFKIRNLTLNLKHLTKI